MVVGSEAKKEQCESPKTKCAMNYYVSFTRVNVLIIWWHNYSQYVSLDSHQLLNPHCRHTIFLPTCQRQKQSIDPFILKVKTSLTCWVPISTKHNNINFLGRESDSHYHVQLACLKLACSPFSALQLIVPPDVKAKLTSEQIKSIEEELLVKFLSPTTCSK